jgi:hypothetical protein
MLTNGVTGSQTGSTNDVNVTNHVLVFEAVTVLRQAKTFVRKELKPDRCRKIYL